MKEATKAILEIVNIPDISILSRKLEIDGERCTLMGFLYTNLCEKGVNHILIGEAKNVIDMNVGDTVYIGTSTITRIK